MRVPLLFLSIAVTLMAVACSSLRRGSDTNQSPDLLTAGLPTFSSKEPERYQATRTITTTSNGNTTVTKISIVRDGISRSEEYIEPNLPAIRYVYLPTGNFIVGPTEKIFCRVTPNTTQVTDDQTESAADQLIQLETDKPGFQRMGTESVGGRTATKFRIVVNNTSTGTVSSRETTIWIDEMLGIPIKSEARGSSGDLYSIELSDIKLEVDPRDFQIPEGFQEVDIVELMRRLRR